MSIFIHSEKVGRDRPWLAMALGKAAQLVVEGERPMANRPEATGSNRRSESLEGPRPRGPGMAVPAGSGRPSGSGNHQSSHQ